MSALFKLAAPERYLNIGLFAGLCVEAELRPASEATVQYRHVRQADALNKTNFLIHVRHMIMKSTHFYFVVFAPKKIVC